MVGKKMREASAKRGNKLRMQKRRQTPGPGKDRGKKRAPIKEEIQKLKDRSKGLRNKSSLLPQAASFNTQIQDNIMTKSMDPNMSSKKRAGNEKNKGKRGNGEDWGFGTGPVRLNHTHAIDFSGTGGSGNALNRLDRKQMLNNLLDSGKKSKI